jgi:hypothetical protein
MSAIAAHPVLCEHQTVYLLGIVDVPAPACLTTLDVVCGLEI